MSLLESRRCRVASAKCVLIATAAVVMLPAIVRAQMLRVTVENPNPVNGFYITPVFVGFHDGGFDTFNLGSPASPGLELLAEDGPTDLLATEFAAPGRVSGAVPGPMGFGSMPGQPPVIDGGETASTLVSIADPTTSRYFTFASMVIPSNDAFIGNNNPLAYQVFDVAGNFLGPLAIEVFGNELWDAGTEVNDRMGAAFSTLGGTSSDEGGTVHAHPGLDNFEGTGTPVGTVGAGLAPGPNDLIARITITQIPEPGTITLWALALAAGLLVRRRRANVVGILRMP